MGISLSRVEHILFAEREGLGTTDLSKVTINDDWMPYKRKFEVNKTILDNLSWVLFNSEICAKLVMDSPMKPLLYKVVTKLRNKDEQKVSDQIQSESENWKNK